MPRALPWLKDTRAPASRASENQPPKSALSRSAPIKRRRSTSSLDSEAEINYKPSLDSDSGDDEARVEYMLPRDDKYIMVEDEFLTIAQSFTRTLHRLEYDRLKSAATSKNARVISEIQRPVDGITRMSKETVQKHQRFALSHAQTGLSKDDSESEKEDPEESVWGKSSLGVLMCSQKEEDWNLVRRWGQKNIGARIATGFRETEMGANRRKVAEKEKRKLVLLPPVRPNTSEKQIFNLPGKPSHNTSKAASDNVTDSDDDLDLDLSFTQTSKPPSSKTTKPLPFNPFISKQLSNISSTSVSHLESSATSSTSKPKPKLKPKQISDTFDFDFASLVKSQSNMESYLSRSLAARKKEGEEKKRKEVEKKKVKLWCSF